MYPGEAVNAFPIKKCRGVNDFKMKTEVKHLGVGLDNRFNWGSHINRVIDRSIALIVTYDMQTYWFAGHWV